MRKLLIAAAGTALLCAAPAYAQETTPAEPTATATFIDLEGNEVGTATLTQAADGVTISGEVMGLEAGEHGFHIHAVGDCDPATMFESAGDHFNPDQKQHGMENPEGPHAGDMLNQTADDQGTIMLDATNAMVSLTEGEPGYLFDDDGSALMLHSDPDDYMTDPGGNSGDRVACAVIEASTTP